MQIKYSHRLEQLAHMGLPEQVFIPALLQELHHALYSLSNTFCWQDEEGQLNNIFDEALNTTVISNFITTLSSSESDKYTHTSHWVSTLDKITTTFEFYGKCPLVAEFYKTILLPLGYQNSCFVPITCPDSGHRLGVLMIHRKRKDPDFSADEREYLSYVAKVIATACQKVSNPNLFTIDGWEQGLLIVDETGRLHHGCSMGLKLLALASSPKFDDSNKTLPKELNCFDGLSTLISTLIHSKKNQTKHPNPVLTQSNSWGEFKLRAFLIDDVKDHHSPQIGLHLSWQEPFVLKLFHRIKLLKLTPRQETVGLFYAAGDPLQSIADKLEISLHTVKEHIRNISDRLNTKTRADLIAIILCDINL
ncbi:MAG: hypothetical protein GQ475_07675 [Methylococcaceae bacterium]|nr:hypothetical protein [Methylococcaceae bacterium]